MALRPIVLLGDPVLRKRARNVKDFDAALHTLLDDMAETMLDAPGVGLAAPQLGLSLRVIVVMLPADEHEEYGDQAGVLYEVVNPVIERSSEDKVDGTEACLSIPGMFGTVSRHEAVTVKGQDRSGKKIRIKAEGWLARVFQHEIDHLDGRLFIDIASRVWQAAEDQDTAEEEEAAKRAS